MKRKRDRHDDNIQSRKNCLKDLENRGEREMNNDEIKISPGSPDRNWTVSKCADDEFSAERSAGPIRLSLSSR